MEQSSSNKIILESKLPSLKNEPSGLSVEVVGGNMPIAIAFFDIDKTLAHLDVLYRDAIHMLFPEVDRDELIKNFLAGFKLGNSFREFDRMYQIYVLGKREYSDP